MRDVEPIDYHAAEQREFRQRRSQPLKIHAKLGAVVADGFEHAATGRGTGLVGIIVRIDFYRLKPHLGIGLEIFNRLGTARKKGIAQIGIFRFGNGRGKIACRIGDAIVDACPSHRRIDRNPDHPARPRGRSADELRLLDHKDAQPLGRSHCGCRHSAGARTDDDDIVDIGNRCRAGCRFGHRSL